jgi:LDH2 family malate/lactate/ureidoglycolate dehydrogenase
MVDGPRAGADGQFFIAIDVAAFTDPAAFGARVDAVRDEVRASRRREGVERLLVPGDLEAEYEKASERGIVLSGPTINDILEQAEKLNVDASRLAG